MVIKPTRPAGSRRSPRDQIARTPPNLRQTGDRDECLPSGKREVEIWIDEDGRVELRYWAPSGASPDQITATAMRALNAVLSTTPEAGPSRD